MEYISTVGDLVWLLSAGGDGNWRGRVCGRLSSPGALGHRPTWQLRVLVPHHPGPASGQFNRKW